MLRHAISICLVAAAAGGQNPEPASADAWVGTWMAAPQLVEPRNLPPAPGLAGNTLRQTVQLSLGGRRIRLRFSNEFGDSPLTIAAARVAMPPDGGLVAGTTRTLSFNGRDSITIPAGRRVWSDPVDLETPLLARIAVTIQFGAVPGAVTGHPGSRTTSYLAAGAQAGVFTRSDAVPVERWYVLTGADVLTAATAAAVSVLGNSITDGRGSGTDKHNRWPDHLARRLSAGAGTAHIAVLNAGIGGNCVTRACLGPPALDRLDRDVLEQSGVRWLIVLEGVNDIGTARGAEASAAAARDLIAAHARIIERARRRGLRVYGATLLPFGGSFYDSPQHEAARRAVNEWIRTSGAYDAVIDLDAALRDPANPARLRPEADSGDHLHPNEVGHGMIAEAVDLSLFRR